MSILLASQAANEFVLLSMHGDLLDNFMLPVSFFRDVV